MTQSPHQRTKVNKIAAKLVRGNIGISDGIQKIIKKLYKKKKHKKEGYKREGYSVWNYIEDVYLGNKEDLGEVMWTSINTTFIYLLSEEDVDVVQTLIINQGLSSVNITTRQLAIYQAVDQILEAVVIVPSVHYAEGYREFDFVNTFKFDIMK